MSWNLCLNFSIVSWCTGFRWSYAITSASTKHSSRSIITQIIGSSISKLVLKLINMFLLDWINCFENVPIDILRTWWSCDRSSVGVSVISINHHVKLSVSNLLGSLSWSWILVSPIKWIKEIVNDLSFPRLQITELFRWAVNRKQDSKSCCDEAVLFSFR